MTGVVSELHEKLGYAFQDNTLLHAALTHRSAAGHHNERLEFLGDAILNFIIAAELYAYYPLATEGELSRLRANLVNETQLATLANNLGLGGYMVLGKGEVKSGGAARPSLLADALEALLGAVYLDGGLPHCRDVVLKLYREPLSALRGAEASKDAKTRLQEYLQSAKKPVPVYRLVEVTGEPHAQAFTIECQVAVSAKTIVGHGSSRRRAEQDAAAHALRLLSDD